MHLDTGFTRCLLGKQYNFPEFSPFFRGCAHDYASVFKKAGFAIVEEICPLADQSEDKESYWKDETHFSPYVIFVLKK